MSKKGVRGKRERHKKPKGGKKGLAGRASDPERDKM